MGPIIKTLLSEFYHVSDAGGDGYVITNTPSSRDEKCAVGGVTGRCTVSSWWKLAVLPPMTPTAEMKIL